MEVVLWDVGKLIHPKRLIYLWTELFGLIHVDAPALSTEALGGLITAAFAQVEGLREFPHRYSTIVRHRQQAAKCEINAEKGDAYARTAWLD